MDSKAGGGDACCAPHLISISPWQHIRQQRDLEAHAQSGAHAPFESRAHACPSSSNAFPPQAPLPPHLPVNNAPSLHPAAAAALVEHLRARLAQHALLNVPLSAHGPPQCFSPVPSSPSSEPCEDPAHEAPAALNTHPTSAAAAAAAIAGQSTPGPLTPPTSSRFPTAPLILSTGRSSQHRPTLPLICTPTSSAVAGPAGHHPPASSTPSSSAATGHCALGVPTNTTPPQCPRGPLLLPLLEGGYCHPPPPSQMDAPACRNPTPPRHPAVACAGNAAPTGLDASTIRLPCPSPHAGSAPRSGRLQSQLQPALLESTLGCWADRAGTAGPWINPACPPSCCPPSTPAKQTSCATPTAPAQLQQPLTQSPCNGDARTALDYIPPALLLGQSLQGIPYRGSLVSTMSVSQAHCTSPFQGPATPASIQRACAPPTPVQHYISQTLFPINGGGAAEDTSQQPQQSLFHGQRLRLSP